MPAANLRCGKAVFSRHSSCSNLKRGLIKKTLGQEERSCIMQPTKQSTPRSEFENMPGGLGHDADKKTSPSDLPSRGAEKAQELATAVSQKASSVAETAREAANKA